MSFRAFEALPGEPFGQRCGLCGEAFNAGDVKVFIADPPPEGSTININPALAHLHCFEAGVSSLSPNRPRTNSQ